MHEELQKRGRKGSFTKLAFNAIVLNLALEPVADALLERHLPSKHGPTAYSGQR